MVITRLSHKGKACLALLATLLLWGVSPFSAYAQPAVLVKDINPSLAPGFSSTPQDLVRSGDFVYFRARTIATGYELWRTDGTEQGTIALQEFTPGDTGSTFRELIDVDGTLFFTAGFGEFASSTSLWRSDGTEETTRSITNPQSASRAPFHLTAFNGELLFSRGGSDGIELWRSDGTESGTQLLKDIQPGPIGSNPNFITVVGNRVFLEATDGVHGRELWVSDG
ncbi:MAG: hypothetical protein AAGJ52_10425, partial [Pseudomonadota bacterium]